ncbi:GNAT family N-acetyltransferase [Amycolatopsis sp. MEPSY49]|uniref:GNAT family N-acetyltransferase n=1 Tax=Amycolatopsis sp. MEPSY49 TaxID=3151600 RepID=UPI003EF3901F
MAEAGVAASAAAATGAALAVAPAGGFRVAVSPGPVAVGTMVLRDAHPADLWHPADDPGSALYLHHLAVGRAFAGRRIGAWLLDQAAAEAGRRGKRYLRLDAWTSNTRLHDYYRSQGFRLVRFEDDTSGALFERPVSPP